MSSDNSNFSAILLDGKLVADQLLETLKGRLSKVIASQKEYLPTLATVLVGDDPASATYVKMKGDTCKKIGLGSRKVQLPASTTTTELLACIEQLNSDPEVCGILLQHPVPHSINERACFDAIRPEKDVDGVGALGFGRMAMGEHAFGSATPAGIMALLKHYQIALAGKHAVVVGRSPILGKPMAAMLLNADCTVTICHSRTKDLPSFVRQADLLVAAVGKPHFIQTDWIKPGAVVIDAGFHPGRIGDIQSEGLAERASAYTPVPGGVGPMTIATLIEQTVQAAEARAAI